jgi:hypothetical protein
MSLSDCALETKDLGPLYRVERKESATTFHEGALLSRGHGCSEDFIDDNASELLRNHFVWRCKIPSPFISLFRDKDHARRWAAPLITANPGMVCSLYEIDPARLAEGIIFNASQLVDVFEVRLPFAARSRTEDEYLVLQRIPKEAIEWVEEILDQSTTPPRNSGHKSARQYSAIKPAPVIMMGKYAVVSPSLPPTPTSQLGSYAVMSPSLPSTQSFGLASYAVSNSSPSLLPKSSERRPVQWQSVTMHAPKGRYKDQNIGTMVAPRRNHDEAAEAAVYDPQIRERAIAMELRDGLKEIDDREEGEI